MCSLSQCESFSLAYLYTSCSQYSFTVFYGTSLRHTFSASVKNVWQILEMKQTVHNRCQLCPTGSVNGRAWNINNQLPLFLACSVQVELYNNNNNNNKKNNNNNNNNNHIDIMHNTANHNRFLPIFYSGGVINKDACQVKIYKIQKFEISTRTELFYEKYFCFIDSLVKCQNPLLNKKETTTENVLLWFETSLAHLKTPKQRKTWSQLRGTAEDRWQLWRKGGTFLQEWSALAMDVERCSSLSLANL